MFLRVCSRVLHARVSVGFPFFFSLLFVFNAALFFFFCCVFFFFVNTHTRYLRLHGTKKKKTAERAHMHARLMYITDKQEKRRRKKKRVSVPLSLTYLSYTHTHADTLTCKRFPIAHTRSFFLCYVVSSWVFLSDYSTVLFSSQKLSKQEEGGKKDEFA